MTELCACGQPLHYEDDTLRRQVDRLVNTSGPDIQVEAQGRVWMVPRHYIALHGLKAWELPSLGFPEKVVTGEAR